MKTNFGVICLAWLVLGATPVYAEPVIVERTQQFRVWENIQSFTNELGEVSFTTNRWTELGNGICYQDPTSGVWLDSEALVEPHPLGAIAQRAPHTVLFAQDIATPGAIDILLPDRVTHLRGHPLGLYFHDALSGDSELIAPVASAVGEILLPNKVIYRGAFGAMADMVYVCDRGFVTACVIMRQRPVLPPGFNAEFARLQVISEWLDPPVPQIREQIIWQETHPALRARMAEPDLIDQYLDFGSMQMILGKAFAATENFDMRVPSPSDLKIAKHWTQVDGRSLLIESLIWKDLEPALVRLPVSKRAGLKTPDQAKLEQMLLVVKPAGASRGEMKLASSKPAEGGFVLDATIVNGGGDYTFSKDVTYWVTSGVGYSGNAVIEGGTVVKYDRDTFLYFYGTLQCNTSDNFATFTAVDDHTTGEKIGSGVLSGYYAAQAIWLYYIESTPLSLRHLQVAHAQSGIYLSANMPITHTVADCAFQQCQTGLLAEFAATGQLENLFMCDVSTNYTPSKNFTVGVITTRCDPLVNDPALDTRTDPLPRRQRESSIVLCGPPGSIASSIVVGYTDRGSAVVSTNKQMGFSLSTNSGVSFIDKHELPSNSDGQGDGFDPTLAFESEATAPTNGIVYFATNPSGASPNIPNKIRLFRSYDRGNSFVAPVNIGNNYFLTNDLLDKPWIAVDNFGTGGSGKGNVYLIFLNNWGTSFPSDQNPKGVYFYRSIDHGTTWTNRFFFPDTGLSSVAEFPFLTVAPNHSVYAFYYQESSQSILALRGSAQGTSWSGLPTPIVLSSTGGFGGTWFLDIHVSSSNATVVRNVCALQAAANPVRTGDIYLVYPDKSAVTNDNADVFFTMLPNGASTWTAPVRVNNPGNTTAPDNDQWNPVIAVKPNGNQLFVGYYDRSADANNTLIHAAGRIGTIDGSGSVTFGPRVQVSSANFPVDGVGEEAADYDTATADNSAFYYTWSDNRNRMLSGAFQALVNEANVRFTRIPSP